MQGWPLTPMANSWPLAATTVIESIEPTKATSAAESQICCATGTMSSAVPVRVVAIATSRQCARRIHAKDLELFVERLPDRRDLRCQWEPSRHGRGCDRRADVSDLRRRRALQPGIAVGRCKN